MYSAPPLCNVSTANGANFALAYPEVFAGTRLVRQGYPDARVFRIKETINLYDLSVLQH